MKAGEAGPTSSSERVLVLAPTGRDGAVIAQVLTSEGISAQTFREMAEFASAFSSEGGGAFMFTEEALAGATLEGLVALLREQSSWSDVPIIVLAAATGPSDALARIVRALDPAGTVTVLERPVRKLGLVSAVRTALRARHRQYEAQRLLAELETKTSLLEEEKAARERFVSVLAHDLRGPLGAARMGMHLLLEQQQTLQKRLDLKLKVDRNLDRVETMIRNLLDANRIQAGGRLPLRIDECDVVGLCREVVEELLMARVGSSIELSGPEHLVGFWSAEEVRRALWNLVSNALKYGEKDAPVVVRVQPRADSVELSVHNQGPAIPADEIPLLFEPYRRTRHGRSLEEKGWGLGLTLVRGCAEAHGGTVQVESDATRGTTFRLTLPRDARVFQADSRHQGHEVH